MADPIDRRLEGADTARRDGPVEPIDFRGLDDARERTGSHRPESPLLSPEANKTLDPSRTLRPVHELHPDRLAAAAREQTDRLTEARAHHDGPEAWARFVNPGFRSDVLTARSGRTQNCADCSRSVEETLDGKPRAAAAIDRRGLPLAGDNSRGGENVAYTEQWAGRRFEGSDYDSIGDRVRSDGGSAIVVAFGRYGGHAFNAVWDQGAVKLVDGQTGKVYDWDNAPYRDRFNRFEAIHFQATGRSR